MTVAPVRSQDPVGTPASRWFGLSDIALCASLVVGLSVMLFLGMDMWLKGSQEPRPLRALIVDQLGDTNPGATFRRDTEELLRERGYHVDYVPPANVSIGTYRRLAELDYDLIILRSHSIVSGSGADSAQRADGGIGTNQIVDDSAFVEGLNEALAVNGLVKTTYIGQTTPFRYWAITPSFITSQVGRFDGTTIILMGCGGLSSKGLARAFRDRGASQFIGWDGYIAARDADYITGSLLRHLVHRPRNAHRAVEDTMRETGPDPIYGSTLSAYP